MYTKKNYRECPDKKKTTKDPLTGELVPVRFLLGDRKILHAQFEAEVTSCSYSTFCTYIPDQYIIPKPSDWGTCLCSTCLNPKLKLEEIARCAKDNSLKYGYRNYDEIDELAEAVENVKIPDREVITFVEWKKVAGEKSKKTAKKNKKPRSKFSKKVNDTLPFKHFKQRLLNELKLLKNHLFRVHMQYKAFKAAREEAISSETTATIHIDWSENAKLRQAEEEKGAYYHDVQMSAQTIFVWTAEKEWSAASISGCTIHKAEAVAASITELLEELKANGITKLYVVSDSPTSQYRNKEMFYLIKQISEDLSMEIDWIYLESGHGKGIPDGIGAVLKTKIDYLISVHPRSAVYTVDDLFRLGLRQEVPSIKLYRFDEEDVDTISLRIPELERVPGTMKIHEVQCSPNHSMQARYLSHEEFFTIQLKSAPVKQKLKTSEVYSSFEESDDESIFLFLITFSCNGV